MRKLTTALVFIVIAGGAVFAYYKYGRTVEKPTILQTAVTTGPLTEVVQATGGLEALRTVNVGAQVSGTVSALYADYNSVVKQGQIIAELDPSLLETQVKVQQANVEKQQTDIEAATIQLTNDKRVLDRTQAQFDAHLVSQQALDQAVLAVKTEDSALESAKKMLVSLQEALKQAQLNVSYCTIRSPIDGVVVQRAVDIGQTVQSSMTTPTFFQLAEDLATLRLNAQVDEADIGKIRPNEDVTFIVDAYPQQIFTGKVDRVRLNAVSANNVVTYQVTANVDNKDLKLRPAMTAQLKVIIQTKANVLRVSNQALRFKPTADMYAALGAAMPPPSPGRGGRGGGGDNANADPGQSRRNGGGGFGQGLSSMTPEQRQQLMNRYGGGRGGRGNGNRNNATNQPPVPIVDRAAEAKTDKIDDLFSPLRQNLIPGQVYTWNEGTKELKRLNILVGITDGQQTEISGGGLKAGDEIVTSILVPVSLRSTGGSPLMGNQPRGGGPGGLTPGRPGGGGGGGGRGGN